MLSYRQVFQVLALLFATSVSASTALAGSVLYVDDDATGARDGTAWCDAFVNLQDALIEAAGSAGAVTEIRIAQGLYAPDVGSGQTPGRRESTFQLQNGVRIIGGFAGCQEANPQARDVDAYPTILTGDLSGDDVGNRFDASRLENTFHVVTGSGTDATAVLDGVSITAGRADGLCAGTCLDTSCPNASGAGNFNERGSPTIIDCSFYENWSRCFGGAIYNSRNASPLIRRCTIVDNSADWGGGINNDDQSSPVVEACVISRNFVGYNGGGIYNQNQSHPFMTDCTITDNQAFYQGGGVANFDNSNPRLDRCVLARNRAKNSVGGGMSNEQSSPTLTRVTFLENHAKISGGGVYNSYSHPILRHCVFQDNDALNGGAMINSESAPEITNCLFERNRSGWHGGAIYNKSATGVEFLNCTFTRNVAGQNAGGMYNDIGSSPTLRNTVLWNNSDGDGSDLGAQLQGGSPTVDYSCIQAFDVALGVGNRNDDPRFVPGPAGCSYLSQLPAGNAADSPCVNVGGESATDVGLEVSTTRTDEVGDAGTVDMGYHYPVTGDPCLFDRFKCEQQTDLREMAAFITCFTNTGAHPNPCCAKWDLDGNGSIDLDDFDTIRTVLAGP